MKLKSILLLVLLILTMPLNAFSQCAGCTVTISGDDANLYTLNAGDVICITTGGNFTGTLNLNGGILCNEGIYNAGTTNRWSATTIDNYGTLSVSGNFFAGFVINNHGSGIFNYSGGGFSGATLNNAGEFNYTGDLNMSNTTFSNTGDFNVTGTLAASGNLTNDGTLNVGVIFRLNNTGSMINNGTVNAPRVEINDDLINNATIETTNDFVINGGTTTNNGVINSQQSLVHNNGILNNDSLIVVANDFENHQTLTNTDLIIVTGNFTNNEPLTNSGCVDTGGSFINNSTLTNNATMQVNGDFTNNSAVNNNLYMNVTGDFLNNGGAFSGTGAAPYARVDIGGNSTNNSLLTGFLDFNDISTPGGIDVDFGTVHANVSFGIANSGGLTILPCSIIILPIDLLSFNLKADKKTVVVSWSTVSETNNNYFTVERSKNGFDWEFLAKVDGLRMSNTISKYKIIDQEPHFGVSYYRLKQTDFDENFSYSQVRTVKMPKPDSQIQAYPNPTTNLLTIKGDKIALENFAFYNSLGQDITPQIKITKQNQTNITLNLSKIPKGMYLFKTINTVTKVYKL